jgi:hypothetical protein
MPLGQGKDIIREYIAVALGQEGGNLRWDKGRWSRRKWRKIGPKRPKGSMAKGRRAMLLERMSPMMWSPGVDMPVVVSCFVCRLSLRFL